MNLNWSPPSASERRLIKRALVLLGGFTLATALTGSIAMMFTQRNLPMIVPKIVGLDEDQARKALASKGLKLNVDHSQFDEHIPKGLLMAQNPKPNQYLRRGQMVTAGLSKGTPRVKVPNLAHLSFAQAQITLAGARLKAGKESLISSSTEPKENVLAQVPAPGETVDSFTEVNLLVSAGSEEPTYVMPYLRNQSMEKAFKFLRPAGITIEKIKNEVHDDLESETILSQSPAAGSRVKKKDGASFLVSSKSTDQALPARYTQVRFEMPPGNPKRLQIDVFDGSGTRTIYNKMESPGEQIEVGVSISGKASAQVYLNQEFVKEIPIE